MVVGQPNPGPNYTPAPPRDTPLWSLLVTNWTPKLAPGRQHQWGDHGCNHSGIYDHCYWKKLPYHPPFLAFLNPESKSKSKPETLIGHTSMKYPSLAFLGRGNRSGCSSNSSSTTTPIGKRFRCWAGKNDNNNNK